MNCKWLHASNSGQMPGNCSRPSSLYHLPREIAELTFTCRSGYDHTVERCSIMNPGIQLGTVFPTWELQDSRCLDFVGAPERSNTPRSVDRELEEERCLRIL